MILSTATINSGFLYRLIWALCHWMQCHTSGLVRWMMWLMWEAFSFFHEDVLLSQTVQYEWYEHLATWPTQTTMYLDTEMYPYFQVFGIATIERLIYGGWWRGGHGHWVNHHYNTKSSAVSPVVLALYNLVRLCFFSTTSTTITTYTYMSTELSTSGRLLIGSGPRSMILVTRGSLGLILRWPWRPWHYPFKHQSVTSRLVTLISVQLTFIVTGLTMPHSEILDSKWPLQSRIKQFQ